MGAGGEGRTFVEGAVGLDGVDNVSALGKGLQDPALEGSAASW